MSKDIPSASRIRSNIERFNNIDLFAIGQMFVRVAKNISPCGNKHFFALMTDDTKHGHGKKCHVFIYTCYKNPDDRDYNNPRK